MKQKFLQWLTYWLTWVFQNNPAGYVVVMSRVMRMFPAPPVPPTVTLLREDGKMLIYGCNAPVKTAPDVALCEFTARIDGQPDQIVTQDIANSGPVVEISANDNDAVSLTCVFIDDAGNRSPDSPAFTFTATDTIAPGSPDAPGVTLLREE